MIDLKKIYLHSVIYEESSNITKVEFHVRDDKGDLYGTVIELLGEVTRNKFDEFVHNGFERDEGQFMRWCLHLHPNSLWYKYTFKNNNTPNSDSHTPNDDSDAR